MNNAKYFLGEKSMNNKPFQRKGAISNADVGKKFENRIFEFLGRHGFILEKQKKVAIGINAKKDHAFDFGSDNTLIECKSQTWTESGNSPSAKIKNWSDAMFSFYLAPSKYKKLFFVEMSYNQKQCKTLLEYFIEHYFYLIPKDVVLIDYYTNKIAMDNYEVYAYDVKEKKHLHKDKECLWSYLKE